MPIRVLPDFLINQIAAGEVVERPASVVKELVENALDAGADQIVIDVVDGGRTMISVIDNGGGMSRDDLAHCIMRHATSKLPSDDLLDINFMGFRGEALPSIASVSDMTIDTFNGDDANGWHLDCATGEIKPAAWDAGTRIRVQNLFAKTPARLKFLRSDRAEMMSVLDVVKRLAMARADVGFTLNNKWRFPKNQDMAERVAAVMGDDVRGRMLAVDAVSGSTAGLRVHGLISEPTLRRATSVDQFLFVNGRPVRDKVLVAALRAAYVDVMHPREFPLCALYLEMDSRSVDVNVSPAKTDVHFLEPSHVRAFLIKSLRDALAQTLARKENVVAVSAPYVSNRFAGPGPQSIDFRALGSRLCSPRRELERGVGAMFGDKNAQTYQAAEPVNNAACPLGRVIGQLSNKYILAQSGENLVIVDQHAAHERITYEKLRKYTIKVQPLLTPIVVSLRDEDVMAVLSVAEQLHKSGLYIDAFGDRAIAIFEKPADWDLNWADLFHAIADEVRDCGDSTQLIQRLHLKLANYACHHSVRAGQKLDFAQMDALLRDIENTERGGECNHGRPVYKIIPLSQIDGWFERV
ncbi:MAG: DNA mismatch repair endonuclease MutL [Proteobacteria bacterium]|uniref:DNA mismatch repair protein MutL n=1 Tax=Candidatus Enterousia excrementavium TaxID=2840789 RepID=A0A940DDN0_9PROT|nr:DNA mismatch repair endonuclease MutL [Candidatus Enterousia excrementavium]